MKHMEEIEDCQVINRIFNQGERNQILKKIFSFVVDLIEI
jgi:hypothetical protein